MARGQSSARRHAAAKAFAVFKCQEPRHLLLLRLPWLPKNPGELCFIRFPFRKAFPKDSNISVALRPPARKLLLSISHFQKYGGAPGSAIFVSPKIQPHHKRSSRCPRMTPIAVPANPAGPPARAKTPRSPENAPRPPS